MAISKIKVGNTEHELQTTIANVDGLQTALDSKSSTSHTHKYAGSSNAGGAATSANKLNTNAGSTTQPVYFSNGVPVKTTYTLGASVPSDAKFTDSHYASKNVVGSSTATSNTTSALTNGNVYLNSVENGVVTSAHKISGSGAATVTSDASGNIIVSATNTTYSAAGSSLGLVKSGGDVTISSGVITVNDDSHNHVISNVDGLQTALDGISTELDGSIKGLSVSGKVITYTKNDGTTGTITTQDTNTTYSNMTAATSSAAGKAGLVPAPAAGKQASFLRGDGTWVVPTNTTYSNFVKSGSSAKAGLVPAPSTTAGTTKYLREDGTWATPPDTNTTYSSLKNPYALTIQGNGTTLTNGTYDGSAAKTVNITPASIGAATSGHTHNYAGSSSAGGAATSANKVYGTLTNPTSSTAYQVPFHSDASSENKDLRNNNGLTYRTLEGTAFAEGYATLEIGNSTKTGTVGNKSGALRIYSSTGKYVQLSSGYPSENSTITFPNISGEVVLREASQALTNKTYNGYTLGDACSKSVHDSTSASGIRTSANLVTERDVYYGLPNINNSHSYTSNNSIYAPTSGGMAGQILYSNGSFNIPTWTNQSDLSVGSATKAAQDSAGQQINTTYIKGLSVSGKTITYTKGDGTTETITTQDTNTTYTLDSITGTLDVSKGGTGATSVSGAITNLGAMDLTSAQTASGVKTFSSGIKIGSASLTYDSTNKRLVISMS